jgi:hypothetical protein
MSTRTVQDLMVEWFELTQHEFQISWHALQALGVSRFVELFDPCREYVDLRQALNNALMGCFIPLRDWAKNEKRKRSVSGDAEVGVWESFLELRPRHLNMESKIRYARRFWSRLFSLQCFSAKSIYVFELAGVPDDYRSTSSLIDFIFTEKMANLLSRIRNNIKFKEEKAVYRDLHLFDVVLLFDLMILNGVRIPIREADQPGPSRRLSSRLFFR